VHRDIKSDNILLDGDGRLVLADFGCAAQMKRRKKTFNTVVGSPYWMAPEVIRGGPYNQKVDIWSLGVVMRELADGVPPHADVPAGEAMRMIVTKPVPPLRFKDFWSSAFVDFLGLCMEQDASKRPDALVLLQHDFLRNPCPRVKIMQLVEQSLGI